MPYAAGQRHHLDFTQLQQRFQFLRSSELPRILPPDLCSFRAQAAAAGGDQRSRVGSSVHWTREAVGPQDAGARVSAIIAAHIISSIV